MAVAAKPRTMAVKETMVAALGKLLGVGCWLELVVDVDVWMWKCDEDEDGNVEKRGEGWGIYVWSSFPGTTLLMPFLVTTLSKAD